MSQSPPSEEGSGLSPGEQEAMRDFWEVYEGAYEEVSAELEAELASHPEVGRLLAGIPPEVREEQRRVSRALMRAAILDGAWEPYLEHLRVQGAGYARQGLSFQTWFLIVGRCGGSLRRGCWPPTGTTTNGSRPRVAVWARSSIG